MSLPLVHSRARAEVNARWYGSKCISPVDYPSLRLPA